MLEALTTPALVATVAAVLVSLYSTLRGWQAARKSNIPWVSVAPLVLAKHPSAALHSMVRQNGPAILLSVMNYHSVVISSAELAKQVLKQDQIIQKFTALTSESVERTLTHGIVASNGADWKRHRESSRGFMMPEMISTFIPKFLDIAAKVVDHLSALPEGSKVDFGSISTKATIDVLGLTIIGTRFGALDGECPEALEAYKTFTTELEKPIRFIFPPIERLHFLQMNKAFDSSSRALASFIDGIVQRKIQDRKSKQADKYDMVDVMLDSYLDPSSPSHITKEEFHHDLLSFFLAGHETTAGSLSWFLLRVARHQDVQEKLFQEIQEVTGGEFPTEQDLSRLHYLHCVKKEVMRLHPPLGLIPTRISTQDFPIPGTDYILPKGAMVILDPYSIHRDPEEWDDPDSFRPERFEDKSAQRHPFAFLPFSAGRRHCVGEPFSLAEQDAILSVILQKFRVHPVDDEIPLPKSAIISSPASCHLRFERRSA